ncbi:MAG: hypothetical protein JNL40_06165 [Cyclobacteriaceae bacterium]|nr:hypothetical protein [Cyclobacteriaceae bacterium]
MNAKPLTLLSWILHTSLGWIVGIVLFEYLTRLGHNLNLQMHDGQSLVGLSMGAGVGLTQWLLLRKHAKGAFKWFWSLFLGFSFPFVMVDLVSAMVGLNPETVPLDVQILGLLCTTVIGSSVAGYFQYNALMKSTESSDNWIMYHSMAWVACFLPMAIYLASQHFEANQAAGIFILMLGGPLLGFLTGMRMIKIFSATPEEAIAR